MTVASHTIPCPDARYLAERLERARDLLDAACLWVPESLGRQITDELRKDGDEQAIRRVYLDEKASLVERAETAEARVRELEAAELDRQELRICGCPHKMSCDHAGTGDTTGLTFGRALEAMREGKWVRRTSWPAEDRIRHHASEIMFVWQDGKGKISVQVDSLLATDWEVLP